VAHGSNTGVHDTKGVGIQLWKSGGDRGLRGEEPDRSNLPGVSGEDGHSTCGGDRGGIADCMERDGMVLIDCYLH